MILGLVDFEGVRIVHHALDGVADVAGPAGVADLPIGTDQGRNMST
jgi:hypothetical protein